MANAISRTEAAPAPRARRLAPERRCAVTRQTRAQGELVRFVTAPDGSLVVDLDGTLPGRGLWVGAERALIERALRKGVLARAGRVEADIADHIERGLARRCRDLIGLARRAGQLVAGAEAVRAALAAGRAEVLIEARDGAPQARARLARLGRAVAPDLVVVAVLDRAELGAALGRDDAVHLALAAGRLAGRLAIEAGRLAGFRPAAGDGDVAEETMRR